MVTLTLILVLLAGVCINIIRCVTVGLFGQPVHVEIPTIPDVSLFVEPVAVSASVPPSDGEGNSSCGGGGEIGLRHSSEIELEPGFDKLVQL